MRMTVLLSFLYCSSVSAERTATFEDAYGYTVFDSSTSRCVIQPIDIATSGTPVDLIPTVTDGNAADEGSARLTLVSPFEFYGDAVATVTVSSNGYVALGGGAMADDGGDFSNDCPLPAVPDNTRPSGGRIYALHDDLIGNGDLYAEYFAECPRPSGTGLEGACTILLWEQSQSLGTTNSLTFQVLLYHATATVAVQYLSVPVAAFSGATAGLQNNVATSAANQQCNRASVQVDAIQGYCAYDPRFPSAVQLDTLFLDGFQ